MSKALTEEANYSSIAASIRAKLADGTMYLPEEMAAAIDTIGRVTNGVGGQYTAALGEGSIPPFTFIQTSKIVDPTRGSVATVSNSVTNTYRQVAVVALNSTTAVLFYAADSSSTADLLAVVCSVNGNETTMSSPTIVASGLEVGGSNPNQSVAATLLESGKVFVAYKVPSDKMYGAICTVSGTTITVAGATDLGFSYVGSTHSIDVATISGGVVAAHRDSVHIYCRACAVSGTTITPGTEADVITDGTSSQSYARIMSIAVLDPTHFCIVTTRYAVACSVSGTTITAGTQVAVDADAQIYNMDAIGVSSNSAVIFYLKTTTGNNKNTCCRLLSVTNNTITVGSENIMRAGSSLSGGVEAVAIAENEFIAFYSSVVFYGKVSGSGVIVGTPSSSQTGYGLDTPTSSAYLGNNKIIYAGCGSGYKAAAYVVEPFGDAIMKSVDGVDGITITTVSEKRPGEAWFFDANA